MTWPPALLLALWACGSNPTPPLDDDAAKLGYSIGYQVGGDMQRLGRTVDADALVDGVGRALHEEEPAIDPEAMRRALAELQRADAGG